LTSFFKSFITHSISVQNLSPALVGVGPPGQRQYRRMAGKRHTTEQSSLQQLPPLYYRFNVSGFYLFGDNKFFQQVF
jgi:hypothetical protein